MDFLSYHFYASGSAEDSDAYIYNRIYNGSSPMSGGLAKHTKDIRDILTAESPKRSIGLWLDEYNISWSWNINDSRMRNVKGAVFDALAMIYAHKNGADATMAWNEKDGTYGKIDSDNHLRVSAQVFHLFNSFLIGKQVVDKTSNEENIVSFAVKNADSKQYATALVNRGAEDRVVQLSMLNWKPADIVISG
ncbi:hypothetical protein [Paenibacillus roseipurpureus]|uniref:Uncharacterized protein n=1 Tax=Paenibacillus roseopurpureus TaxID=2918901 RepID=A0AA96RML6_9BACL|nr:hypothetical protein [Paenibacillus sp. MBLB1832]WNR46820.1 hypothetical protein MJB10_12235 [Paenibacillus sp. MBLB1832]